VSFGFRGKLLLVSVALLGAASLASLGYVEVRLRDVLTAGVEAELERHARSFRATLRALGEGDDRRADTLAKAGGDEQEVRLTLISPSGRVLADSDVPQGELAALEVHQQRPEVRAALGGERGVSRRTSSTTGTQMLYVALPFESPRGGAVVRAAMPLSHVDTLVDHLRLALFAGGLFGLAVAIFISGLASHLVTRTLRDLVRGARRLADGCADGPIVLSSGDEMQSLAGSMNRLSQELTGTMEALAAERDRTAAVLEGMHEGLVGIDGEGVIELANSAARALLGIGPLVRRRLDDVLPALPPELFREGEGEAEIDLPGSPPRQVLLRRTRTAGNGRAVVVLREVTQMRRLESVRSDFVANVSHELRTPVTVIRANAEALRDGALFDPVRGPRFVDALHRNAERLSQLVSDLLDLARIEAGRAVHERAAVDLATLATRVVSSLEEAAFRRRQTLRHSVPPELRALGDESALEQVLMNLVENAVKYTPEGGTVHVSAALRGVAVRLEVQDDGPGIAPEHRGRIFERFYRVDAGRSRQVGGTGLGLSIVKHLVLAMDGTVGVEPRAPSGSVFWVELPASLSAA
jgi:two-component system, OmpR family, phosphate regulon sensor histidine kinase PhoR